MHSNPSQLQFYYETVAEKVSPDVALVVVWEGAVKHAKIKSSLSDVMDEESYLVTTFPLHYTHFIHNNPRCACAARVVRLCVSVTTFSATVRNKAVKKRYQRVQRYTDFIIMAIFVKILRSKVMQ